MAEFVPYGKLDSTAIQCIHASAVKHQVPEALLHAFIKKEGGTMGKCSKNTNGTLDCGLAQINTIWAKEFAQYNVDYQHVVTDVCLNTDAQGYIARKMYNAKKDWFKAIMAYNIGPNNWTPNRYRIGHAYASDVVKYWWNFEKYRNSGKAPEPLKASPTVPVSLNYTMPPMSPKYLGSTGTNSQGNYSKSKPAKKTENTRSHPKAPFFFSVETASETEPQG